MSPILLRPETVAEAASVMAATPGARLLAGGIGVTMGISAGQVPPALVSLQRVPELRGIQENGGGIDVGALTTHEEMLADPATRRLHPALVDLFSDVGNVRVRTIGTVGGNLVLADPLHDPPVLLTALGAEATLVSPLGERRVPVAELAEGPGRSTLQPDEVLTRIWIPRPDPRSRTCWVKVQAGSLDDYATVSTAVQLCLGNGADIERVRVVVGAAASRPHVLRTGKRLLGRSPEDAQLLAAIAADARDEVDPVADHRGSVDFKRHLAGVAVRRALQGCASGGRSGSPDTMGPSTPVPAAQAEVTPAGSPADSRVMGAARYTGDIPCEGALHAAFVRSTVPHADIVSIDTSRAQRLPGVAAVLTGQDVGDRRFGRFTRDYPVLAVDRVLFAGQPVAAVAAVDAPTAHRAAELVTVTYRERDAVLNPEAAFRPDAPVLHPGYDSYVNAVPDRCGPNVQGSDQVEVGDGGAGFDECDEVFEHTFTWDRSHSLPLEPHTCLVDASRDTVHVWAAHKEPFKLRRDIAVIAGRAERDVVVHPVPIGGDFGSKGSPFVEAPCYLLSAATGRPVRASLPFSEDLTGTGARHAGAVTLRTGLRAGRMHAHEASIVLDGGAFVALKPMPKGILPLLGFGMGSYDVPHRCERSVGVYTNNLPGGHVRSPGEFQLLFAAESHVDLVARALDEDPVQFRARHSWDPRAVGVLDRLRARVAGWPSVPGENLGGRVGVGVSLLRRGPGPGESTARIRATRSGVTLAVGVPDQGAGSYRSFQRIVAKRLALPDEMVHVVAAPTSDELTDAGAGASRVSVVVGRACLTACDRLEAELGVPAPAAEDTTWLSRSLGARSDVEVTGIGGVARGDTASLREGIGALAVQVVVDPETGICRPSRAALVVDTGPVLNAVGHRGQLEGGFVYGLSQALYEALPSRDGRIAADSLRGYKIAGHLDVPELEIDVVEPGSGAPEDFGSVGAVGELVNIGVPAAVANAVADAVSARVTRLPITAERVLTAAAGRSRTLPRRPVVEHA